MWSRRRFVGLGLAATAALGIAVAVGQMGEYALTPDERRRLRSLGVKELVILRAVARCILAPDSSGAPTADQIGVAEYVDGWLADADPPLARDFGRLLRLVEHGTPLLYGRRRRFTDLDLRSQTDYLLQWSRSRLPLLREGLFALRSLCVMGYYRDPRTWPLCGYEGPVVPRGWSGGESAP
jgi:hypothetical protein